MGWRVARSVHIGRDCLPAGGVHVFDRDGHPLGAARRAGKPAPPEGIAPMAVRGDVWVGSRAYFLKG